MAYASDFSKDPGNYNIGKRMLDGTVTLVRYFDCSTDNLANGSYYKLFAVPADFVLLESYIAVVTAEGAAETLDLVDDDSATTTFMDDVDLNTANGVVKGTVRKLYSSAGDIAMLANADLTAAKFYVIITGQILNTAM